MSYRDLRNFAEMMRALGYTRLISTENFRNPNFPLVAEILIWLVKRFDPEADVPLEYNTETERVKLIRLAAQFMASKVNIKLNTKNLYQADGYAVRELLKATSVLYGALRFNMKNVDDDDESDRSTVYDIVAKANEIKKVRSLASEITAKGAALYDLLGKEVEMREARNSCIAKQMEIGELEEAMKKAVEMLKSDINNIKQLIENVSTGEASLDSKIEKKRIELDRNSKRLQTLRKVRPAFMEEFEHLEAVLRDLYTDYVVRFRSLAYLEQQQEDAELAEQERMEEQQEATKRLIEKMKQEEKLLDEPCDLLVGEVREEQDLSTKPLGKTSRVRIQTASRVMRKASARRVFGSMNGPAEDDDDDDDSLDSDSDLLLDGDGSELLGTDEEEDEVLGLGVDSRTKQADIHSDDDF
ncbi:clusterin-associated protein 1 [Schistocerca americana]|nr:clusterin-associated protein 1 [Schistocerca americana]XP_049947151.1 clusterin-associated protein 1 isoform X1 [Schistocerca serialis cubense]